MLKTSPHLKKRDGAVSCPEYLFADQSIEIPCPRCHQTTPKTVDWIRANDRYACAGCNAQIVVDQDTLLAQRPKLL
jgi:transposase-like protein